MRSSFAVGLLVLGTAASCAQPDILSVKAPAAAPEDPSPATNLNGATVDGRWSIAPGAHFKNLSVDIKQSSASATGARVPPGAFVVTGTFSGVWDQCGCTVTGRVTEQGAAFASEDGSYRQGPAVRLFLSFGQDPVAPFKPFATYEGLLTDSTRAVGALTVITGEGYFGDDGYGQGKIEMRKSGNP